MPRPLPLFVLAAVACGPTVPFDDSADGSAAATTNSGDDASNTTDPVPTTDPTLDPPDPPTDLPSGADTTAGDAPDPSGLDCDDFDPARVYLRGTLSEGASYLDALTDPTDPNAFCVGFLNYAGSPRIRPGDHRVVFVDEWDGGGILEYTPDPITWDPTGYWNYPGDPYGNDTLLVSTPCGTGTAIGRLLVSPVDGGVWYECRGSWFDPNGALVYPSSDPVGLAVTQDGRLLVAEPNGDVFFVATGEIPGPPLELPRDVDAVLAGRHHEGGIWLVALLELRLFRWNLVGDAIVEDGEYTNAGLGNASMDVYAGVLDAEGDFFHIAGVFDGEPRDVIVRRRLDPAASEIVYDEATLDEHAVKIHISELFTGP